MFFTSGRDAAAQRTVRNKIIYKRCGPKVWDALEVTCLKEGSSKYRGSCLKSEESDPGRL